MQLGVLEYLIQVNDKGVSGAIGKSERTLKNGAERAERVLKNAGNKISAWTIAKGQLLANYAQNAINVISNFGKSIVKDAIGSYANREQLVGGVETLFGDAAQVVIKNAEKAYKTAGISANEYMETVTGFSASLLQSLGGDTFEAAKVSDMALQDMSDNANKMGTSMDSIMHAYQGFSKQNYTMLDNLKLGYGGTKTEMQRLLKDAEKLTGVKYDISNLSDVYEAIHAIQTEMGITGTTALEAEKTISGSMGMMKSAWSDLLTTIADPKGDVKKAMDNVFSSVKAVLSNLKPVLKRTLTALIDFAKQAIPELWHILKTDVLPFLKGLVKDVLKAISDALGNGKIFDSLFKKVIPKLVTTIKTKVLPAVKKITDNISSTLKASDNPFVRSLGGIVDGLSLFLDENGNFRLPSLQELWGKLEPALKELWQGIQGLATNILKLVFGEDEDGGIDWPSPEEWGKIVEEKLTELWDFVKSAAGTILKLVFGEDENGGIDWPTPEEWGEKIKGLVHTLWETVKGAASSLLRLVFGSTEDGGIDWPSPEEWKEIIKNGVIKLWDTVKSVASSLLRLVFGGSEDGGIDWPSPEEWFEMLKKGLESAWNAVEGLLSGILTIVFGENENGGIKFPDAGALWEKIKGAFSDLWNGVKEKLEGTAIWTIGEVVFGTAKDMWEKVKEKFGQFWSDFKEYLKTAADWVLGKLGLPSVSETAKKVQDWWDNEIKPKLNLLLQPVVSLKKKILGYDPDAPEREHDPNAPTVSLQELWEHPEEVLGYSFQPPESNAKGNWMVPYDNFPALLHRDEMVLTKSQARQFRDGASNSGISGDALAAAVEAAMSRVYVMMSGEKVGDLTTKRIKRNINASSYSRMRALGG